jgi:hypothetical protein
MEDCIPRNRIDQLREQLKEESTYIFQILVVPEAPTIHARNYIDQLREQLKEGSTHTFEIFMIHAIDRADASSSS